MQVHRGVMPSHTMYALNMERIISRLWHPSHEELEQDHVHRQRLAAKEGVLISWEWLPTERLTTVCIREAPRSSKLYDEHNLMGTFYSYSTKKIHWDEHQQQQQQLMEKDTCPLPFKLFKLFVRGYVCHQAGCFLEPNRLCCTSVLDLTMQHQPFKLDFCFLLLLLLLLFIRWEPDSVT